MGTHTHAENIFIPCIIVLEFSPCSSFTCLAVLTELKAHRKVAEIWDILQWIVDLAE